MTTWLNGIWLDDDSPLDRGATLGDGLFETILWDGAELKRFECHLDRLRRSARALALPTPPESAVLRDNIEAALQRAQRRAVRSAVRLRWSVSGKARGLARGADASPSLAVSISDTPRSEGALILHTSRIARNQSAPSARHKTLSYIDNVMAYREAESAGADEAVQFNTLGRLAGGARSNIFCVINGRLLTPPIGDGALPGTRRAALLAARIGVVVAPISRALALRTDALAISNTLMGVRVAQSWDGRILDTGNTIIQQLMSMNEAL